MVCQDISDKESKWTLKGRVVKATNGKNSYVVLLDTGGEIIRHRHHIRTDKAHPSYRADGMGEISVRAGSDIITQERSQNNVELGQSAPSDCTDITYESDDDDENETLANNVPQARSPGPGQRIGSADAEQGGGGPQPIEGVRRHTRANPGRVVPSLYPINF